MDSSEIPPSLSRICPCLNCWCFKSRNPRRRKKMATNATTTMPKFASIMAPFPHHSLKRFAHALSCHILTCVLFSAHIGLFFVIPPVSFKRNIFAKGLAFEHRILSQVLNRMPDQMPQRMSYEMPGRMQIKTQHRMSGKSVNRSGRISKCNLKYMNI